MKQVSWLLVLMVAWVLWVKNEGIWESGLAHQTREECMKEIPLRRDRIRTNLTLQDLVVETRAENILWAYDNRYPGRNKLVILSCYPSEFTPK